MRVFGRGRRLMRMLFHVPWAVRTDWPSATEIRPRKMLAAFQRQGFDVTTVVGNAVERREKVARIERELRSGGRFDFVYSESPTLPTLIANGKKDTLSTLNLDFGLLGLMRSRRVPIGLFYRDVYWRFPGFFDWKAPLKATAMQALYRYDLHRYKGLLDVMFLPSMRMATYVGSSLPFRLVALPSGVDSTEIPPAKVGGPLTVLYVGGLGLHYDIRNLFDAIRTAPTDLRLIVCCREAEWATARPQYEGLLAPNIRIEHGSGDRLRELYAAADVCSLFVEPSEYRDFAMPMKLFEYLGQGKPVIATSGTAAADFVDSQAVGWTIPYETSRLTDLLRHLIAHAHEISARRDRIRDVLADNTWEARARLVAATLTQVKAR